MLNIFGMRSVWKVILLWHFKQKMKIDTKSIQTETDLELRPKIFDAASVTDAKYRVLKKISSRNYGALFIFCSNWLNKKCHWFPCRVCRILRRVYLVICTNFPVNFCSSPFYAIPLSFPVACSEAIYLSRKKGLSLYCIGAKSNYVSCARRH